MSTPSPFEEALMNGGTLSSDGSCVQFLRHGLHHRTNGPAVVNKDGSTRFVVYGIPQVTTMSDAEWEVQRKRLMSCGGTLSDDGCSVAFYDKDRKLHREYGPAIVWQIAEAHYWHGERHNTRGPALVNSDGTRMYYEYGKLHRELDQPAIRRISGVFKYYMNGELRHKTPSYAEWEAELDAAVKEQGARTYGTEGDGNWCYIVGNKITYHKGDVEYRVPPTPHGVLHRMDGPALVRPLRDDAYCIGGVCRWEDTPSLKCGCTYHYDPDFAAADYIGDDPAVVYKTGVKLYFSEGVYTHSNAPEFVVQHNLKTFTPPCMKS